MSHVRQQIRDALVARLKTDITSVSNRVFGNRLYAIRANNLPAICVYSISEQSDRQVMSASSSDMRRSLTVAIDVYVTQNEDADDQSDTLTAQIEASVGADPQLSGIAKDAILTSTEMDLSGEGEVPFVLTRLIYSVEYVTSETDAETAL